MCHPKKGCTYPDSPDGTLCAGGACVDGKCTDPQCTPCAQDSDCTAIALCVSLDAGKRCLRTCDDADCKPQEECKADDSGVKLCYDKYGECKAPPPPVTPLPDVVTPEDTTVQDTSAPDPAGQQADEIGAGTHTEPQPSGGSGGGCSAAPGSPLGPGCGFLLLLVMLFGLRRTGCRRRFLRGGGFDGVNHPGVMEGK